MTKPDTAKTPAGPPPMNIDQFPHYTATVEPMYGMLPFGRYVITLHPIDPPEGSGLISSATMLGGLVGFGLLGFGSFAYTFEGATKKACRLVARYNRRSDRRKLRADQLEYLMKLRNEDAGWIRP